MKDIQISTESNLKICGYIIAGHSPHGFNLQADRFLGWSLSGYAVHCQWSSSVHTQRVV